jgi:hypothetical protein
MCVIQMHVRCSGGFFEVSPADVDHAELMVEDVVCRILLDLFGEGMVDEVTIRFPSHSRRGHQQCTIHIRAQCLCQNFVLLPRTEEHMKCAIEQSMCSLLRELFGSVSIESVTFSPSPWDYGIDPALSSRA